MEASELQFSCKHAHTFIIALHLLLLFLNFWNFSVRLVEGGALTTKKDGGRTDS
jgi:hypothetical protein